MSFGWQISNREGVKSGIVTHKNGIIGIYDKGAIGPRSPVEGQIGPDDNFFG